MTGWRMAFDGINKWVWIGAGIGSSTGPTHVSHNRLNGLAAYDAALDRFLPWIYPQVALQ